MLAGVLFTTWLFTTIAGDEAVCSRTTKPSLKLTGNATITAILDGHSGPNCTTAVDRGRQEMATLAWVVNTVNHAQFLPGGKIGLSLYDGCSTFDSAEKSLLAALMDNSCTDKYSMGLVTTPAIFAPLKPLTDALSVPVSLTSDPASTSYLSDVIAQMLVSKNWTTVDYVIASSSEEMDAFSVTARGRGICVLNAKILATDSEDNTVDVTSGLVVVIGPMSSMYRMVQTAMVTDGDDAEEESQWILVPTDLEDVSTMAVDLPALSIVVTSNPMVLRPPFTDATQSDPWASVNRHVFLDVASAVFDVVRRLKFGAETSCVSNTTICSNLPPFRELSSVNYTRVRDFKTVQTLFQTLHITTKNENSVFYVVSRVEQHENGSKYLEKIGSYQILDYNETQPETFKYNDHDLKNDSSSFSARKPCTPYRLDGHDSDCQKCANFRQTQTKTGSFSEQFFFASVTFREEGWVPALISISILGVLCCLAVAVFVTVRSCKGDVLEGNPSFSFLLLFAIVLTYSSIVPFSVHIVDSGLLCGLRIFATCTSYALLFSIMLARSLMLASCDNEGGFMSHVNGYLQTVLCFFMCGVQISLSVQFWIISTHFLHKEQCTFYKGYVFLVILSYDAFLLLIFLCSTPFIAQSKRNYREGVFYTAAAILCTLIWAAWVVAYVFAPKWRDFIVAAGLTATATAVLISVFIPRTYLMISALTRDNIANALPAMVYNSTSILDLNYRSSSQALYATVNLSQQQQQQETMQNAGVTNPNFYSDQPDINNLESNSMTVPSTAKLNSCAFARRSETPENTYERYDTPPSPLKVTRF